MRRGHHLQQHGTSRESADNAACVKDGGIAYNLRRALAERAQTARDGARILMELVDEWGYAPSGRAYTIADQSEAFMFQLARGRHYMAHACRMTRLPSCPITSTCTG